MTTFENSVIIHKPATEVYTFLKDLSNHEQLMPDNIQDWKATPDEASFTIKNMASLHLEVSNRVANREVSAVPKGKAPIDITLKWTLEPQADDQTKATFTIQAELNMMLKMIASGPLQKLVDHQVQRLGQLLQ
ncbi:MAG: orotate phosphoribosyltransferase [Bacteroidetes bacterium 47-18]|nr:MAG: orotate phosphoribosyltransferase [Bacteroidetes bacterium 47-18]